MTSTRSDAAAPPTRKPEDLRTVAGLANGLRPAVMRLARRLRQMRDDSLDLSANQLSALSVLLNCGDQLMGELASAEKVAAPSMTRTVNGLVERGLVLRRPDPRDRRQCLVALTAVGERVLLDNRRRRSEWLARRIAELSHDDKEVLRRAVGVLERINAA